MYIDTAVSDYWRALALPYEEAFAQLGGELYVKKASVEFHASARLDDALDIGMRCERVGTSSMLFRAGIFRGDQLLITGELVYVFADPASQTARPVPQALRDILSGFEAGNAMVHIRTGPWSQLQPDASAVRVRVFVDEQKIPLEMEWDEADNVALHAVAYNRLGQPLATGRLLQGNPAEPGVARIGRMAVERVVRGTRLGRDILETLADAARQRGDREVRLHAQCSAQGFYGRLGFSAVGAPFEEAGIAHIEMARPL
jgi:YbgC/YbaW family acyl-CoA thioester hydrolase